jgi:myo-inositol 2-dehydrogenase / D-chiro-inositol 1-dehydrogenase
MTRSRIGFVGGGAHARANHLPAVQRVAAERAGEVELAAFCDLNAEVARSVAAEYGFGAAYTDVGGMLATERLDGCIAITPVAVTARVARQIIEAGVALVMEKPPGGNPAEAREICERVGASNVPAMVSVNRRFDPALVAARRWLSGRRVEFLRATMLRVNRQEPDFFFETALHSLDAMRWFLGDIADHEVTIRRAEGVLWYRVAFTFVSGASGLLEVMPTCGVKDESYELFGSGFRVMASTGEAGSGEFHAWAEEEAPLHEEPAKGQPGFVRNGTLAETEEFVNSLARGCTPAPAPGDVLQSVELSYEIQSKAQAAQAPNGD